MKFARSAILSNAILLTLGSNSFRTIGVLLLPIMQLFKFRSWRWRVPDIEFPKDRAPISLHSEMAATAIPTSEVQELTDYFDTCRRKRNHIDYDGSEIVSRTETEELIQKVQEYREIVERGIEECHSQFSLRS